MWGCVTHFHHHPLQIDLSETSPVVAIFHLAGTIGPMPDMRKPQLSKPKSSLILDDSLVEWLRHQDWSEFATSIVSFYDKNGGMTVKQRESGRKMRAKLDESYGVAEKSIADGMYIDRAGERLYKLAHVSKNGYKTRTLRMRRVELPNWHEVKNGFGASNKDDFYESVDEGYIRLLTLDEMRDIGRKTGICCACGRALDDPKSIEDGIGPICAKQERERNQ